MYNIKILSECNDKKIVAAITAAVLESLGGESSLNITRMKRSPDVSPVWNRFSRYENLNNKF